MCLCCASMHHSSYQADTHSHDMLFFVFSICVFLMYVLFFFSLSSVSHHQQPSVMHAWLSCSHPSNVILYIFRFNDMKWCAKKWMFLPNRLKFIVHLTPDRCEHLMDCRPCRCRRHHGLATWLINLLKCRAILHQVCLTFTAVAWNWRIRTHSAHFPFICI